MKPALKTLSHPLEAFEKLCALIKDINFAMLTTMTEGGKLRGRPMGTQKVDFYDNSLWFFASEGTPKIVEIYHEQQVCVTYAEPTKHQYVSVSGQAMVIHDKAKARELWNPAAEIWFPKGVDDPKLVLLRVGIESAEYWDAKANSMVQLYRSAKALLTGEPPKDLGENVKLEVKAAR